MNTIPGWLEQQLTQSSITAPVSVKIKNLSKIYLKTKVQPIEANKDISLEIYQGEIFGLLGPNGAGKTTLVNQILGLVRPSAGHLSVEGIDVINHPEQVKALISYLPQQNTVISSNKVFHCLIYAGQLRGLSRNEANDQANQLLEELNLTQVANRPTIQLSGGMRRMVGLATALMGHCRLLILDEPTNELDPERRYQVWEYLKKINSVRSLTCLLVTHNVAEAENVIGRVAVLARGRMIALGTPGELKQATSNQAQLELIFKQSALISSKDELAILLKKARLDNLTSLEQIPGTTQRFRLYLKLENVTEVMSTLERGLGWSTLDDLKLSLPSLENAYLKLVGQEE